MVQEADSVRLKLVALQTKQETEKAREQNPLLEGFLDWANEQNGGGTKKSRSVKEKGSRGHPVKSIVLDDQSFLQTQSVYAMSRGSFAVSPSQTTSWESSQRLLTPSPHSSNPSENLLSQNVLSPGQEGS